MQKRNTTEWLSLVARSIVSGAAALANLCLVGMLIIIFSNVILRYAVRSPFFWGDEVMIHLMIIMVYAGFGFVLLEGGHIRVTVVVSRLPAKVQNLLWVIVSLFGTGYAGYLLYAIIRLVLDTLRIGAYSDVTFWPIAPWQIVIAFGLFSLLVAFVILVTRRTGILLGTRKEKEAAKEAVEVAD